MKIAVSDNGNEGKRKLYLEWLQSFAPDAELTVVGYSAGNVSLKGFDGLVLTGGEDVDPRLSKASPIELVQQGDRRRDDFEFHLLEMALKDKKPVLGICRGLQITNVFLGGSLVADLQSAGYSDHTVQKDGKERRHSITIEKGSLMQSVAGISAGEINSYHHQSVLNVGEGLMVSGRSPDGVVESLEWKHKTDTSFLLLVQWHPERMMDKENPFTKFGHM